VKGGARIWLVDNESSTEVEVGNAAKDAKVDAESVVWNPAGVWLEADEDAKEMKGGNRSMARAIDKASNSDAIGFKSGLKGSANIWLGDAHRPTTAGEEETAKDDIRDAESIIDDKADA
jgi:hypothetical protein